LSLAEEILRTSEKAVVYGWEGEFNEDFLTLPSLQYKYSGVKKLSLEGFDD